LEVFALTRLQTRTGEGSDFSQVFGRRPDYARVFFQSYNEIVRLVDPILFELGRARAAQLNGSAFDVALRFQPAIDAGLSEEKIRSVSDYATSPLFSEDERAWIEFVEQFTIQSSMIDDDMCNRVLKFLSPEQFALHTRAHWAAEGVQRFCVVLDIAQGDSVPPELKDFVRAPVTQ
jgi:alkylhydroperoxidase family enzyme